MDARSDVVPDLALLDPDPSRLSIIPPERMNELRRRGADWARRVGRAYTTGAATLATPAGGEATPAVSQMPPRLRQSA